MSPEVAARLREFGQYLEDVDEAWEFVADTISATPNREAGGLTDELVLALTAAT